MLRKSRPALTCVRFARALTRAGLLARENSYGKSKWQQIETSSRKKGAEARGQTERFRIAASRDGVGYAQGNVPSVPSSSDGLCLKSNRNLLRFYPQFFESPPFGYNSIVERNGTRPITRRLYLETEFTLFTDVQAVTRTFGCDEYVIPSCRVYRGHEIVAQ